MEYIVDASLLMPFKPRKLYQDFILLSFVLIGGLLFFLSFLFLYWVEKNTKEDFEKRATSLTITVLNELRNFEKKEEHQKQLRLFFQAFPELLSFHFLNSEYQELYSIYSPKLPSSLQHFSTQGFSSQFTDSSISGLQLFWKVGQLDMLTAPSLKEGANAKLNGFFLLKFSTEELEHDSQEMIWTLFPFAGAFWFFGLVGVLAFIWKQTKRDRKLSEERRSENEKKHLWKMEDVAKALAHEVRNPLNTIGMGIQRLQFEFAPEDKEESDEFFTFTSLIKSEVDRLQRFVNGFLTSTRNYELIASQFSNHEFIKQLLTLFQGEMKNLGLELIQGDLGEEVMIDADREKLIQVFENLLRNSMRATSKGKRITVTAESMSRKNVWCFMIHDEGEGISKDQLEQVFDLYYTTKLDGTGLGLFLCKQIVEAHHGKIQLLQKKEKGIIAKVTLPIRRA